MPKARSYALSSAVHTLAGLKVVNLERLLRAPLCQYPVCTARETKMSHLLYRVPFNNQHAKKARRIRVICIGAGLAGMTLSYMVKHGLQLEDIIHFHTYERQVGVSVQVVLSGR